MGTSSGLIEKVIFEQGPERSEKMNNVPQGRRVQALDQSTLVQR